MKLLGRAIFLLLAAAALVALVLVLFTRNWATDRQQILAMRKAANPTSNPVDMRPLETAQQLAPLAVTHTEQNYAEQALRLGDHAVDLAFASAIRDATTNAAPQTPQMRQLVERVQTLQAAVDGDQKRIATFTATLEKAKGQAVNDLKELLAIAQSQLALDQDDLEDAQQELVRSGGDRQATIQQLLDQHKATESLIPMAMAGDAPSTSPEATHARNLTAEMQAWYSLRAKRQQLAQAQSEAQTTAQSLATSHHELGQQSEGPQASSNPNAATANTPGGAPGAGVNPALTILHRLTLQKAGMADLNRRIVTQQQLAGVYANWISYVNLRARAFAHQALVSALWVLVIAIVVLTANYGVQKFFGEIERERRFLLTLRAVILFTIEAIGIIAIFLVLFGRPNNFATAIALIGAGLTVVMKDFIVGFFGWFVLIGRDGIRPGDWVEINGVGGEVVKVGLLHTTLLETGNWTDADHPTGRKVSFVNSFAIEGHYFNFSTAGQWMWDEVQVQVPDRADPYATAEAIQKIAMRETGSNEQLAEEEWKRVMPYSAKRSFSAAPSVSVRPTGAGVDVALRYITRAGERYETRARVYRAIVDLLHGKDVHVTAGSAPAPSAP